MADLNLDILVLPTYNTKSMSIADSSTYPTTPVSGPTIEITPPGFDKVSLPFNRNNLTIYTSRTLGLTDVGVPLADLPDGVYTIRYSVAPASLYFVEKSIMRVDQLQEEFDEAFMRLDMMECDRALKLQAKVNLTTIYFFIQGAIAAANNCAVYEATKLYRQASKMLSNFTGNNCGGSGTNYISNIT